MAQNTARKENKDAFFTDLVGLDSLTGDSEDTEDERLSQLISASKKVGYSNPGPSPSAVKGLSRPVSAPQPSPRSAASPKVGDAGMPQERALAAKEDTKPTTMKRAKTTGILAEPKAEDRPNKRRRTYSARTIPEPMQIFKGLVFCQ